MTDNNVIDISDMHPYTVSEVICIRCCHRWIAVRPESTLLKELFCPSCNRDGGVIMTGQEVTK